MKRRREGRNVFPLLVGHRHGDPAGQNCRYRRKNEDRGMRESKREDREGSWYGGFVKEPSGFCHVSSFISLTGWTLEQLAFLTFYFGCFVVFVFVFVLF